MNRAPTSADQGWSALPRQLGRHAVPTLPGGRGQLPNRQPLTANRLNLSFLHISLTINILSHLMTAISHKAGFREG